MDLRLPPLPDLLQLNLISRTDASVPRTDAIADAKDSVSQGTLPPHLEKLLQLQKLQDQAFSSLHAASEQPTHVFTDSTLTKTMAHQQQTCEISGAELAPMLTAHSSQDQQSSHALGFNSSISNSFLEVDEQ
jgi:hypothetical protein